MSELLAKFIIKNKAKTVRFLKKNGVKASVNDSALIISDKIHDFAASSDAASQKAVDFITEGKSGFAWLTSIFGGEKSKSDLTASNNNTQAAIINQLTTKQENGLVIISAILLVAAMAIMLFVVIKKG